jgi:catechol 2,3-dioxygenase-like lactoylglutathione lyase family enzyme
MSEANHILTILAVTDLQKSVDFYRRAFGWETEVEVPVYVEFKLPGGNFLGVYVREAFGRNTGQVPFEIPPGELSGTEIYLRVTDLPRAVGRLESAGARLLSAAAARDWGDTAAYYADPDGNVLVVASR